jgi:hypothetical protein
MEVEAADTGPSQQVCQLDAVVRAGWRVPGTGRVLVDRTRMLEPIDRIRVALSEQVQAAFERLRILRAAGRTGASAGPAPGVTRAGGRCSDARRGRARRVDPEVGLGQAEQVGSLTGRCGHGLMKRPRRFTLPRVVPDQDASTQGPRPPKRSGVITST